MLPRVSGTMPPLYPHAHTRVHTQNPMVVISAVRTALRQAGVCRDEIRRFTRDAFAAAGGEELWALCRTWVDLDTEVPVGAQLAGPGPRFFEL